MADYISSELTSDEKNAWQTSPFVFAPLNEEFHFSLDAAASDKNHLVHNYLTKDDDALSCDWSLLLDRSKNKCVWVNPPYGRGYIQSFINKAVEQKAKGVTTVMLVPATLDAKWLPIHEISEIRIITGGRLSFIHPLTNKRIAGNTKGSMFVIFTPSKMPIITRYIDRDELIEQGQQILTNRKVA